MSKKARIILIVLCVLFVSASGAYLYVRTTPQYSLYQFKKALDNHDVDGAFKYMDVDVIIDALLSDFIKMEAPEASDPWEQAGWNMGKGLMMAMAPAIKNAAKAEFKLQILEEKPSNWQGGLKNSAIWNLQVEKQGKMALITIPLEGEQIKFKMAKTSEGYWRIVKLELDLKELMNKDSNSNG